MIYFLIFKKDIKIILLYIIIEMGGFDDLPLDIKIKINILQSEVQTYRYNENLIYQIPTYNKNCNKIYNIFELPRNKKK